MYASALMADSGRWPPGDLMKGSDGRVSFAVLAVVLLALANVAAVYLAVSSESEAASRRVAVRREASMALLDLGGMQLSILAQGAAEDAVTGAPLSDLGALQRRFNESLTKALQQSFPLQSSEATVRVEAVNASLQLDTLLLEEPAAVPTLVHKTLLGLGPVDVPDPSAPRPLRLSHVPATLRLIGSGRLVLDSPGLALTNEVALDEHVERYAPFLESRARGFGRSLRGDTSEFARSVRYMVSTLVQFRILQGYAWGRFGRAGTTVSDILSGREVEQAVNLALLLEEIRNFRSYDPAQAAGLDASLGQAPGFTADLLSRHARGGEVDPADLFFLAKGLDREVIPLRGLLAQAFAALQDQGAVKYLDYFGLTSWADFLVTAVEDAANLLEGFFTWLTGVDREAEAVKQYFRNLLDAAGADSLLLGWAVADVPGLQFTVPSDGSVYNLTIAGGSHALSLTSHDFLDRSHDGFWKARYETVFRVDLENRHTGIRDFVKDFAGELADEFGALFGLVEPLLSIDPKDSVSIGDQVLAAVRDDLVPAVTALRSDPAAFQGVLSNLWALENQTVRHLVDAVNDSYWDFVDRTGSVGEAQVVLDGALFTAAAVDPDFALLNVTAKASLQASIAATVASQPWADSAVDSARIRDAAELEWFYSVTAGPDSPPTVGSYQRLFQALLGTDGLLLVAAKAVSDSAEGIIGRGAFVQPEVHVPTPAGPFELQENQSGKMRVIDSVVLAVDVGGYRQTRAPPALFDLLLRPGSWADNVTYLSVWDPTVYIADARSPNVHYTDPLDWSVRPFETGWAFGVSGTLPLNLSADGVHFTAEAVPFGLGADVTGYSGGPLEGVLYHNTAEWSGDLERILYGFLEMVWRPISEAVQGLLEILNPLIETVLQVVTQVAEAAQEVIEAFTEVVSAVAHLAQRIADFVLALLGGAVDWLVCWGGPKEVDFRHEGFAVELHACAPNGRVLWWRTTVEGLAVIVEVVDLGKVSPPARITTGYDLLISSSADAWALSLDARFDAKRAFSEHFFEAHAEWDGAWAVDLQGPVIDEAQTQGRSLSLPPIPTPFGPMALSPGYEIRVTGGLESIDLRTAVSDALHATYEERGFPLTPDEFVAFLHAATDRVITAIVDWARGELSKVEEASLYIEVSLEDGVSVGLRFSLVVGGDGMRAGFEWLVRNVLGFLESLWSLSAPAPFDQIPREFIEDLRLRGEGFVEVGMPEFLLEGLPGSVQEAIPETFRLSLRLEANIPAIGALFGEDWGAWRVTFGALFEDVPGSIAGPVFGTGDSPVDVWLLQGVAHGLG